MTPGGLERRDRARAFVPELIPEPVELERSGPLNAKEQRDLDRIHAARDNHQNARWMRGKALAAAFRRHLYRGPDGTRTRQEYLNDEWDGMSESAAYLEIREWPLSEEISKRSDRPAPDSHVRALVEVAEQQGLDVVAQQYHELRNYGTERDLRVTAKVVKNLATFLATGETPATQTPELQALFVPRQLPPARPAREDSEEAQSSASAEPFQNFGTDQTPLPASSGAKARSEGSGPPSVRADQAASLLDGIRMAFVAEDALQSAPTDTLKAIVSSAQAIAAAAEDELKSR